MSEESTSPILSSKDPDEDKLYAVNAADMLPVNPTPATLTGCSVAGIVPSGLTTTGAGVVGTYGVVMTHEGSVNVDYAVTVRLTFSDSQTRDRTIIIPCRSR